MATSLEAFKAFKSTGPIVFLDSKGGGVSKAPQSVIKLRRESHMGNTIPMVMVTNSDFSEGLKGFSYKTLSHDTRKAVRELKKELKTMGTLRNSSLSEKKEKEQGNSTYLAEEQTWTNAEGKKIVAAVLIADEDNVTFEMPGGKVVVYPVAKLSASSQEDIFALIK